VIGKPNRQDPASFAFKIFSQDLNPTLLGGRIPAVGDHGRKTPKPYFTEEGARHDDRCHSCRARGGTIQSCYLTVRAAVSMTRATAPGCDTNIK
jgi:hypothetical protein